MAHRKRIEEGIRTLNAGLEQRVNERTAELERALEELKRLDELKDAFLSSVSHELRTPLSLILSPLESLRRDMNPAQNPKLREYLDLMYGNSMRLLALINDLLELVKLEAGLVTIN